MKNLLIVLFSGALLFCLAACSGVNPLSPIADGNAGEGGTGGGGEEEEPPCEVDFSGTYYFYFYDTFSYSGTCLGSGSEYEEYCIVVEVSLEDGGAYSFVYHIAGQRWTASGVEISCDGAFSLELTVPYGCGPGFTRATDLGGGNLISGEGWFNYELHRDVPPCSCSLSAYGSGTWTLVNSCPGYVAAQRRDASQDGALRGAVR